MLLTYKDYTIVHNVTQLKAFATEPFRYSRWCLESYTAQNGTTARICHIGSCHHTPPACRSHSTTLSVYMEKKFVHVVFQVSCVETAQDAFF